MNDTLKYATTKNNMNARCWYYYLVEKNPDVDPAIILENARAWLKSKNKTFYDCTEEELLNAEIV